MSPDLQALRERFRDQMPGMAEFDELLAKYERLLQGQTALEQKWTAASPARVLELERQLEEMAKRK